jgi:hypothetical protein
VHWHCSTAQCSTTLDIALQLSMAYTSVLQRDTRVQRIHHTSPFFTAPHRTAAYRRAPTTVSAQRTAPDPIAPNCTTLPPCVCACTRTRVRVLITPMLTTGLL